jgi:hypothetical protein
MDRIGVFLRLAALILAVLAGADCAHAQAVLCAPSGAAAAATNVRSLQTGTPYTLDARGCATFSAADAPYFQTQGYVSPTPGQLAPGNNGWSPTIGCTSGSPGTVTISQATFAEINKVVTFSLQFATGTLASCTHLTATLPTIPAGATLINGFDIGINATIHGITSNSTNVVSYDGTPNSADTYLLSGTYLSQ